MSTSVHQPENQVDRSHRVAIPFITTSFARNLRLYLFLWPLWWILGVEQLLLPFFLAWETIRFLVKNKWRFSITMPIVWALLLTIWSLVPIAWIDPDLFDIFLKYLASAISMVLILFVFWNTIRTERDWTLVVQGLSALAMYIVAGAVLFSIGFGRAQFTSVFGRLLPSGVINSSAFFSSISLRTLGTVEPVGDIFSLRLTSIALQSSGLSMVTVLLIPFELWRMQSSRGPKRLFHGLMAGGLFVCMFLAVSRTTYLALVGGFVLWIILNLELLNSKNKPLFIFIVLVSLILLIGSGWFLYEAIAGVTQSFFLDLRPGSYFVRFRMYTETFRLFPEHPIAGWGTSMRLEGVQTTYSAGTHSAPLAMLFQRGIVGLFFYLALWLSIWRVAIRGYHRRYEGFPGRAFWSMVLAALFAFNLRELADVWWWDQTITIVLWIFWGLILTAERMYPTSERK